MKILILYLNAYNNTGIPIGLSYLIPILRAEGNDVSLFETTFYNFEYSDYNTKGKLSEIGERIIKDFKEKVEEIAPDIIGISSASLCLNFGVYMLESLENRPITIFGGVGPTVDYENLIKKDSVDYICVGFAEECLPKLIEAISNNTGFEEIPNLVYKKGGIKEQTHFSQDIDLKNLPIPEWDLFDKRHFGRIFKGEVKRWGNFQLSRGCPFNCAYCVNAYYHKKFGHKIYRFPVEKIVEEMKVLSKEYELDIIRIFDECFGFGDGEYFEKFAELYTKKVGLPSIIETRVETIPKRIEILKKINCISVSLGIEAGNDSQRKQMLNRFVSNSNIRKAFDILHKEGIRSASYNIMGFPEDTREKIFETIELNRECHPDFINVFLFCPFPKTQLRKYCEEKGYLETKEVVDYGKKSIIKNNLLSKTELYGLFRTFGHYVKFPKNTWPLIKRAEKFDDVGNTIYAILDAYKN